jgi:hypothetical protein
MSADSASLSSRSVGAARTEQCHTGLAGTRLAYASGASSNPVSCRTSNPMALSADGGSMPSIPSQAATKCGSA